MMSVREKMDVLDFIINILREHEITLNNLVRRLEMLCQEFERRIMRERYDTVSLRTQEILNDLLGEPISVE